MTTAVSQKQWKKARDLVSKDRTSPYNAEVDRVMGNTPLPLHHLCRSVEFIDRLEDEEYSDEEDQIFSQAERCTNREMYKLAKHMILQSQTVEEAVFYPRSDLSQDYSGNFHLSILTVGDHSGNSPLHTLCSYSCDPTMMKIILENCPSEYFPIAPATALELLSYRNEQGCTPVHFLAEGCPFSCLKLAIQRCRPTDIDRAESCDARLIADEEGDLPLHWAFAAAISPRRLRVLLDGCRESLFHINDKGALPMYEFVTEHCDHWDFQDDDEKRDLWNRMQGMLKAVSGFQDDDGGTWSPLHAIASAVHFIPNVFWSIATEFCENGTYNSDGLLPLHVAVSTPPVEYQGSTESCSNPGTNLMKSILFNNLELIRQPTSQGRLALHLAAESQQPEWVVDTLRNAFPDALLEFDPVTGLSPYMLAAVEENNDLTTTYELLRADPSMLSARR